MERQRMLEETAFYLSRDCWRNGLRRAKGSAFGRIKTRLRLRRATTPDLQSTRLNVNNRADWVIIVAILRITPWPYSIPQNYAQNYARNYARNHWEKRLITQAFDIGRREQDMYYFMLSLWNWLFVAMTKFIRIIVIRMSFIFIQLNKYFTSHTVSCILHTAFLLC